MNNVDFLNVIFLKSHLKNPRRPRSKFLPTKNGAPFGNATFFETYLTSFLEIQTLEIQTIDIRNLDIKRHMALSTS